MDCKHLRYISVQMSLNIHYEVGVSFLYEEKLNFLADKVHNINLMQVSRRRVVSSEISSGKFPETYSNLSVNLLITYVNQLLPSPTLQSDVVK